MTARAFLAALVLLVAAHAGRYVVLGRWAWIPMLAPSFEQRPMAIRLHALGGALALVAGLWQMSRGMRRRMPTLHRAVGWLYVAAVALSGLTGIELAAFSAGGWVTHGGFGLLGIATLAATACATWHAASRDVHAHRDWMLRSYALLLAAVTLRVELPFLFAAFGQDTGYRIVSWACWIPNVLATEWWLRRAQRPASHRSAIAR